MKYDSFEDVILALCDAKDKQREMYRRKAPMICKAEHTEYIARLRGVALMLAKDPTVNDVPSIESLREGLVEGLETILAGRGEEGRGMIMVTNMIKDVAYPDEKLDSAAMHEVMAKIRDQDG